MWLDSPVRSVGPRAVAWSTVALRPACVAGGGFAVTGGHTPGCTSWLFPVRDGDGELLAVDICSLTLLPFISLVPSETHPGIRADFERSFTVLRRLPADIFLASHSSWFGLKRKFQERANAENPADPFIDRAGYLHFIDRAEATFRETLAKQLRRR